MPTLLIANRGEVVVRIARSARAMGWRTVAVHADTDSGAPYLSCCDQVIGIGGDTAADSYLSIEKILKACCDSGADAVHPGYGFLSENPTFAAAVMNAGLLWVGPPVEAMRVMADKAQARLQAQRCGIPVLVGNPSASDDLQRLADDANALGFPLMVKASAGGGGRGMRLVTQTSELQRALEGAQQEAKAAFGDGRLLLERALLSARHIEIQVIADTHGHVIHLGERDCSVQRRHQKLIEEAPSPVVNPALRRRLGEAAVAIARAVNYAGLGTVEFLLDVSDALDPAFYFIEMNTRLQVEHPVTEVLISEDLVHWQLRIAAGELLTLNQDHMLDRFEHGGHAIEARLCAEDPATDHLPQSEKLQYWLPAAALRCDAALESGQWISPHYDSMLAKLIVHAPTRALAITQLADGLERTVCLGLINNRMFLANVLRSSSFCMGEFDIGRLQRMPEEFYSSTASPHLQAVAAWLIACLPRYDDDLPDSWWNWRSTGVFSTTVPLLLGDERKTWQVLTQAGTCTVSNDMQRFHIADVQVMTGTTKHSVAATTLPMTQESRIAPKTMVHGNFSGRIGSGSIQLRLDGAPMTLFFAWESNTFWLQHHGVQIKIVDQRLHSSMAQAAQSSKAIRAPMHGRIIQIHAENNGSVSAGQLLVVMEAMKMEHHLLAPAEADIEQVLVRGGDQVVSGQILITLR